MQGIGEEIKQMGETEEENLRAQRESGSCVSECLERERKDGLIKGFHKKQNKNSRKKMRRKEEGKINKISEKKDEK